MYQQSKFSRAKGIRTVIGSFLLLTTFGSLYSWGNMTTYVTSYMRMKFGLNLTYENSVWVMSAGAMSIPLFMSSSGTIVRLFGLKITLLITCFLMSGCQVLLRFMLDVNFVSFIIVYAISYAFAGIAYMASLLCSIRWFPENKGLVSGIIVAGFGIGSLVITPIQTSYINFNNYIPNKDGYFTQTELLEKVPSSYYLQGGFFFSMQVLGLLLISDYKNPDAKSEEEVEHFVRTQDPSKYITESIPEVKSEPAGLKPLEVLKTSQFYVFWWCMFLNCLLSYYLSSMYKAYGQTFIHDDHFLALVGSIASVSSFMGRIFWGNLHDRIYYKLCVILISSALVLLMGTFILSPYGHKAMFAIWVWSITFFYSGMYSITPSGVTNAFGEKYGESNYGMVFSSQIVNGPVIGLISQFLSPIVGWGGTFTTFAGFSFFALIIVMFYKENQIHIGSG